MAILAIDQGTSATKAIILDEQNQVVARATSALKVSHQSDGEATADGNQMWQSILDSLTKVLSECKEPITAIGLANQGESILAWDKKTGQVHSPVIIWQDSRSAQLCNQRKGQSKYVQGKTGLAIDPYFVAPKMLWLRENYPDLPKDCVITTTDSYLIYKLTGKYVTDKATASRTLLFDLHALGWQQQLADIWQIDIKDLPQLVDNDQIIGEITSPQLPALTGVPLAAAIVDQAAALFGQGCLEKGMAKCTFGTGAFLLANIGESVKISANGLATSLAWQIKTNTSYYLDGQLFTAASAIDWLINNQFISGVSEIDQLPDANGVMAAPSFAGLGAPLWRPDATASIGGLGLNHGRGHIAAAVIDGIAAGVADLLSAMKSDGVIINQLKVDGGLTGSKKLMQSLANLAQINIEVFTHPDATALGVAQLAALATNTNHGLPDAAKAQHGKIYSPIWSADQSHTYLSRWRSLQRGVLDRE